MPIFIDIADRKSRQSTAQVWKHASKCFNLGLLRRAARISLWCSRKCIKSHLLKSISATTIEKVVRGNWGRAIARRTSARQTAAVRLQAAVRVRAIVRDIGPRRVRRRRLNGPTTTVQTCVRRLAASRLAVELRAAATVGDEGGIRAHAMLTRCRRITRPELCAESLCGSANYRGEFQAVFAHYCRIVPVPGGHSLGKLNLRGFVCRHTSSF